MTTRWHRWKRIAWRFAARLGLIVLMSITFRAELVKPAAAQFGSCTGCTIEQYWDADLQKWCTRYYCTDPSFPACMSQQPGAQVCDAGDTAVTTSCSATGVQRCTYRCNAAGTGWEAAQCEQVGNMGNFYREFCNWNAGCPRGPNGEVDGRLTRVALLCTQDGVASQTLVEQPCGSCRRTPQCLPGQPCDNGCPVPEGRVNLSPQCFDTGSGYTCVWNGQTVVSIGNPCPTVARSPFPRAIVGKPVALSITASCDGPTSTGEVGFPIVSDPNCPRTFRYRGTLTWQCADPFWNSATWQMDEREWNVGHSSDNGMPIAGSRSGGEITHIYETSSYGKPANGPSVDAARRDSAYQVQLTTLWNLAATFQYQEERQEERCFAANGDPRPCNTADVAITTTVTISPWVPGPSLFFSQIPRAGALVPQEVAQGSACGVVPIPVIQSQSVLRP